LLVWLSDRSGKRRVARYNPTTAEWTFFDLPTRGTEIRHVSLLEQNG
jgi:hypothetical protein